MRLEAGLTFRGAARFHCRAAWPERLRLNGGLVCGGGAIFPREDWRPASAGELAMLVAAEAGAVAQPAAELAAGATPCCELLAIPALLRQRWWEVAEHEATPGGGPPGYDAFVADVVELLRFKGRPLPERCAASVVASRPGQRSTRLRQDGQELGGLAFANLAPARAAAASVPLALINLGDERTHVVLLNLAAEAVRARCGGAAGAGDALREFARRHADYPLVRVALDPGEGLWLPLPPPAFDGWTIGKTDVDALLVLHHDPQLPGGN